MSTGLFAIRFAGGGIEQTVKEAANYFETHRVGETFTPAQAVQMPVNEPGWAALLGILALIALLLLVSGQTNQFLIRRGLSEVTAGMISGGVIGGGIFLAVVVTFIL